MTKRRKITNPDELERIRAKLRCLEIKECFRRAWLGTWKLSESRRDPAST